MVAVEVTEARVVMEVMEMVETVIEVMVVVMECLPKEGGLTTSPLHLQQSPDP